MPDEPSKPTTTAPPPSIKTGAGPGYKAHVIVEEVAILQGKLEGPRAFIVSTDDEDAFTLLEATRAAALTADQTRPFGIRRFLVQPNSAHSDRPLQSDSLTDDAAAAIATKIDAKLSDLDLRIAAEHTAMTALLDRLTDRVI